MKIKIFQIDLRKNHTKSVWQEGQVEYLVASHKLGAFSCVALGHKAAIEAVVKYKLIIDIPFELIRKLKL